MGFVKKIGDELRRGRDRLTGASKAESEAKKAAMLAKQRAEEEAKRRAQIDAAQSAATAAGQEKAKSEVGDEATQGSTKKKKVRGGKKSLSISRSSGSGINI